MSTNLYVGNLALGTSSADLEGLFAEHGNRDTGRSRGFGFVEMASSEPAQAAIGSLNGRTVDGRDLKVNIAKERSC